MNRKSLITLVLVALLAAVPAVAQIDRDSTAPGSSSLALSFQLQEDYASASLRVSGPDGVLFDQLFAAGEPLAFYPGGDLPDGTYAWELRFTPEVSRQAREAMLEARADSSNAGFEQLRVDGAPRAPEVQSGYFTIFNGALLHAGHEEGPEVTTGNATINGDRGGLQNITAPDQVINDDLIVTQSACIGQDCVNGESFGFDTLRLKENNLRIKFQDTSTSASFPSNDWQITANDSANGGKNKFSVDDIDGGRTPFTIEASAPSNSLFVEDGGRIGLGTATPVVQLNVVDGNTPTLRLEQDGSNGFTPQTWDVAGNEANFFIRDATNGSRLPIQIKPSAPTASIFIEADGDVGIGTGAPQASMHVRRTNNTAGLLVTDANTTGGNLTMLRLENSSGNVQTHFVADAGQAGETEWRQNWRDTSFQINIGGASPLMTLDNAGNLEITGTYTPPSDRNLKENIVPVDPVEVLERLMAVPVAQWNFIADEDEVPHMGPMSQDFYSAFAIGAHERGISTTDADGVAFAAIQGLYQQLQAKQNTLLELQAQNAALLERLEALEERLSE